MDRRNTSSIFLSKIQTEIKEKKKMDELQDLFDWGDDDEEQY
jgi:hypothetical protein